MARRNNRAPRRLEQPDGKIPVAIYARVSSYSQDVENSTDAQLLRCREWAERNNRVVVRVFVDKARSGRADARPDFRQMIEESTDPNCPFLEVLVWKFSRFYRNHEESIFYKRKLRNNLVKVVSINEPVADSAVGRLTEGMLELVDGFQSEYIGEEVKRGTHNLAARGFFCGRVAPFGMMKVEVEDGGTTRHKLAPDPETSGFIRRLFDLALEEKTEKQISEAVNNEGIPSANGGTWPPNRVHDALTNRHYEGTIVWGETSVTGPPTVTPNAHEGIVTPDEFKRVRELLRGRAYEVVNPRHAGSPYLLSSLVSCKQCGAPYNYTPPKEKNGKYYHYLVCKTRKEQKKEACDSPRLAKEDFEQRVMDAILNDILTPDNIQRAIQELEADKDSSQSKEMRLLDDVDKRLQSVGERRNRLYLAYENGDVDYQKYSSRNAELKQMEDQTAREKERIMETLDDEVIILENPDAVLAYSKELVQFLRTEEPLRCRPWLTRFIKRIWIEPHWATVQYRIPLPEGSQYAGLTRRRIPLTNTVRPSTRSGPHTRG